MKYSIKQHEPCTVLALNGEVDMQTSPAARKQILELLDKKNALLVDLSGISYIDSSGVASLVEGLQLAKSHKVNFGLAGVSPAALQVLRLARLDMVFSIYDSVAAGLTAFSGGAD